MGKLLDNINKIEMEFYERLDAEVESSHFTEVMFDEIAEAFARIEIAVARAENKTD